MAVMPDYRMFPLEPGHRAVWAPIYLEPMYGSGERIVAAVVALDSIRAHHVELTLRPQTLRCMYGDRGELIMSIAELVQETLQDHLALGGSLESWLPPVHTCFVGPVRNAIGTDLPSIAARAAALTASLSGKGLDDVAQVAEDLSSVAPDVDRWLQQIRNSVRDRSQVLDLRFNAEVRVKQGAAATKIGYLGDRIAANFDLLVPGPGLSNRRSRSKGRLVDLQILRDQVDMFTHRTSYELMLWVPERNSPGFSQKHLEATHEALSELEEFGDKHELRVRALGNADQAAERIVALEGP